MELYVIMSSVLIVLLSLKKMSETYTFNPICTLCFFSLFYLMRGALGKLESQNSELQYRIFVFLPLVVLTCYVKLQIFSFKNLKITNSKIFQIRKNGFVFLMISIIGSSACDAAHNVIVPRDFNKILKAHMYQTSYNSKNYYFTFIPPVTGLVVAAAVCRIVSLGTRFMKSITFTFGWRSLVLHSTKRIQIAL